MRTAARSPGRDLTSWLPGRRPAAAIFAASVLAFLLGPLGHGWSYIDLEVYRGGGQAILDGARLYTLHFHGFLDFTYPPFAAMVFAPLTLLGLPVLAPLVTAVNLVLVPLILRLALRLAPVSAWLTREEATRLALVAAAAAVWLEPIWSTIGYGQINILIAALVVGDLARADASHSKGVGIGVACALKLTPGIFAAYLLLTGRRRAASTALGTFAASVALGFALVPREAADFWGGALLNPNRVGRVENAANQTLRGAYARVLHSLDVSTWWLPTALLVGALGMALAVRAGRRGDEAGGFSICALTGLLVSPISWSHHWTLAVPALLLCAVRAHRWGRRGALAAAGFAAAIGYSQLIHLVPHGSGHAELHLDLVQLLAADAYVLLALVALGVALTSGLRPRPAAAGRV